MATYIVYKGNKILRTGSCPVSMLSLQAGQGEKVIEGSLPSGTTDRTQKMQGNKVVNKTPQEIEHDNPPPTPIPVPDRYKKVKNKDWDAIVHRLEALESIVNP